MNKATSPATKLTTLSTDAISLESNPELAAYLNLSCPEAVCEIINLELDTFLATERLAS